MRLAVSLKQALPDWAKEASRPAIRAVGRSTSRLRPLPDYLIIGTKRGGTTSLYKYLLQHPNVVPMWPGVENAKKTHYLDLNVDRGEGWYRAHFPTVVQRRRVERRTGAPAVTGEAAPYYVFHPLVLDRVLETLPAVKVVVLLRNPVDRIWSHHRERVNAGTESLPFREALDAEAGRLAGEAERIRSEPGYRSERHDYCSYLARGRYLEHLGPWLDALHPDRLHVVRSEDLYQAPGPCLAAVHAFLGLPELPPTTKHRFNHLPSSSMPAAERERLADYYEPHVAALEARLGRSFGWDLRGGGLLESATTRPAAVRPAGR
ncbi:hypothetical protein GCM10023340_04190 [Nocardioides marinquilinus]|uniref:Sulfotransferase domain-containing protein n=1 Tax=Nocardioides marinquilinus TaxID=1210400 RepID=A0ABP9PDD0_9ACTN